MQELIDNFGAILATNKIVCYNCFNYFAII